MPDINLKPSQRASIIGAIPPQSAAAVQVSGWLDVTTFHNLMAVVQLGTIGAAATVDAKIQQATSNAGAGAKDVAGKAIVQFTKANTDDNKQALINLKHEDLDIANGFKFVQLSITPAVAATLIAGTVYGFDPRYGQATDNDAATVTQVF